MPPHIVNPDRVKPFATEAAFAEWLAANHASAKEVWIKIYKTGSGVPTITPVQAIDVALCWGWIDGVRKSLDETSFLQRYTPRKAKSVWTQIHRHNVARLTAAGRMTPHGQRHVDRAMADGSAAIAPMRDAPEPTIAADLRVAMSANPRAVETLKSPSRPDLLELAKTKSEGEASTAKRAAKAKAKPAKGKAAAAKRPAKATAKPAKGKAAAAKRPAKAKAKPAKGKAAAEKRPGKTTRPAKTSTRAKPSRKAKTKKAAATASKQKAKRTKS